MKIFVLSSALTLSAVLVLSGQESPDPSQQFPAGEGRDLVMEVCAGCHGLEQITATTGTRDDWGGVVYSMGARGLDVTPEETELIVAYLAKNFAPAKKAAVTIPDGEGKDLVQDRCAACHGLDQVVAYRGSKENWEDKVNYMVSLGLAATPKEVALMAQYLSKNFPASKDGEKKGEPKGDSGQGKGKGPAK
jgi:mono/diheme cytochrome c family protein